MRKSTAKPLRGRGTTAQPPNRFEPLHYEFDPDALEEEQPAPCTQFYRDNSQTIITYNNSPDVGFEASINPYRGCEHGCIYCYARPYHEYLGMSAGIDFETKIMVKENAPALLRRELSSPRWKPQVLAMSGVTDPYQPIERKLQLTRRCLEVLVGFHNPVAIVTKNYLVTRDADLLAELAKYDAAAVYVSITTLDMYLARIMEPRTAQPGARLRAIEALTKAGVPTGVLVAPVIPGLTDHELVSIIQAAADAGARFAGFVPIRLPGAVAPLFEQWLSEHMPDRKEKVLASIRSIRGGRLNDPNFGSRMRGQGILAEQMRKLFHAARRKAGIDNDGPSLSLSSFRRPQRAQLSLFE
ncbi:MAG TPA: PA0069 family radical SAM protein [Verrucomicrobiae bacterium]|nr:PA0069 family radical SAM protein [Verrucomicrobiae bacterium]